MNMELDITNFFENAPHSEISGSQMEHGPNAARITWENAKEVHADYCILDSVEKDEAFRAHLKGFGAWSDEEIAAFDDCELNALLLQFIAGDIREVPGMDADSWDWDEYERLAERGTVSSRLFRAADGTIYYMIGD